MSIIRLAQIVEATTGGVARHVLDLVSQLDREQFRCTLYLSFERPDSWDASFRALERQGMTVREIPMMRTPSARTVNQLRHFLQRDSIDLVHLHSAKAGYHGRQATMQLGLPTIYTPHAFPFQRTTDWRRGIYRFIERRLLPYTNKIICVSQGEFQAALQAGFPQEKLVVIANGLDLSQWPRPDTTARRQSRSALGISSDETVIGVLARLTPQKGIDLVLVAAEELLPEFPQARLLIWGDGLQRKALQRMARRLPAQQVRFLGETQDAWHCYAAMDIYCAPSRWEAGPYAVQEAMACGLPIVASEVAGHRDLLEDAVSGLLVAAELPGPLDGALRTLLVDADRRELLGNAARQRIEAYGSLQEMARRTADVYHQVIAESATGAIVPAASEDVTRL